MLQSIYGHDPDAVISTIFDKKNREYAVPHSVDSALICEIISKRLDIPPEARRLLIAAAFTMNVAMLQFQDRLFFQENPLTDEQKKELLNHPKQGVELLRKQGVTDETWLQTVLQHHELLDRKGYPGALSPGDVAQYSRILMGSEIDSAKLSNLGYREPILPNTGIREIFLGTRGHSVDTELVKVLVKELGIYPPGTLVRLKNKEIAIVTHQGEKAHTPIVCSIRRASGIPFSSPVERNCTYDKHTIIEVITETASNIKVNRPQFLGY